MKISEEAQRAIDALGARMQNTFDALVLSGATGLLRQQFPNSVRDITDEAIEPAIRIALEHSAKELIENVQRTLADADNVVPALKSRLSLLIGAVALASEAA